MSECNPEDWPTLWREKNPELWQEAVKRIAINLKNWWKETSELSASCV